MGQFDAYSQTDPNAFRQFQSSQVAVEGGSVVLITTTNYIYGQAYYGSTAPTKPATTTRTVLGAVSADGTSYTTANGTKAYLADIGASPAQVLANQQQRAIDEANAANEARYQEGQQGWRDLYSQAEADIAGMGTTEGTRIGQEFTSRASANNQDLISRGMRGSTLAGQASGYYANQEMQARANLAERVGTMRAGILGGIKQGQLGAIERRNDIAPDPNLYASLMNQYGASQVNPVGGYGGSGYSGSSSGGTGTAAASSYFNDPVVWARNPSGGGWVQMPQSQAQRMGYTTQAAAATNLNTGYVAPTPYKPPTAASGASYYAPSSAVSGAASSAAAGAASSAANTWLTDWDMYLNDPWYWDKSKKKTNAYAS